MNDSKGLSTDRNLVPKKAGNKPGFHNQAALKASARGQFLEALTASKGGKVGRKGLIFKILDSIDRDFESPDPVIRSQARADALKIALGMTKDDRSTGLEDILKAGGNVQISFANYFEARGMPSDRQDMPRSGIDRQDLPGQALTIGFSPPPDPGEAG